MAEVSLSHGDLYRIAAASRLDVLPDQVTVEQRMLMKVTCFAAIYSIEPTKFRQH